MDTLSSAWSLVSHNLYPFRRFFDLADLVFELAEVNITDLKVLEILTRQPPDRAASPGNFWDWMAGDSIRRLNVSLRLSLPKYDALSRAHCEGPLAISSQLWSWDKTYAACATWASVWPAVSWLPKLRSLHIWLELGDCYWWFEVAERQVVGDGFMAVLAANLQARAREDLPHMDVLFHLPRLDPARACPSIHFVTESPRSRFVTESPPSRVSLGRCFRLRFPMTRNLVQLQHGRHRNRDGIRQVESTKERLRVQGTDTNKYFLEVIEDLSHHEGTPRCGMLSQGMRSRSTEDLTSYI